MATVSQNRTTRVDFTALDNTWTIDADVSVAVVGNDYAVLSTIAGSRFTNSGVVFSGITSLGHAAVGFFDANAVINNNAGASITGYEGGLAVNGNGASIINRGAVTGAKEFGILFGSGSRNVVLDNSGNIYGGNEGVWVINSVDGGTINNVGVIRSGGAGISLTLGTGVVTTINNAKNGVIKGKAKAIDVGFGAIDFENAGTVIGLTDCNFQSGDDRIENRGVMGEVRLGVGNDVFVFAGGKQGPVTGSAGSDQFVFSRKFAKKKDAATIADFTPGEDTIGLSKALFKGIGKAGPLKDKFFDLGKKAKDKDARILYDPDTGICRYDLDGKGGTKAKIFAKLDGGPDGVSAGDFVVLA